MSLQMWFEINRFSPLCCYTTFRVSTLGTGSIIWLRLRGGRGFPCETGIWGSIHIHGTSPASGSAAWNLWRGGVASESFCQCWVWVYGFIFPFETELGRRSRPRVKAGFGIKPDPRAPGVSLQGCGARGGWSHLESQPANPELAGTAGTWWERSRARMCSRSGSWLLISLSRPQLGFPARQERWCWCCHPQAEEQLDFSNISEEKQAKVIKYHFPALFCSIFHPSDKTRAPFPSLFHPELQEIWDSLKGISAESA